MQIYLDPDAFARRYDLAPSRARRWPVQLVERLTAQRHTVPHEEEPADLQFAVLPTRPWAAGVAITFLGPSFMWGVALYDSRFPDRTRALSGLLRSLTADLDAKLKGTAADGPV